jgi:hypothetical protein
VKRKRPPHERETRKRAEENARRLVKAQEALEPLGFTAITDGGAWPAWLSPGGWFTVFLAYAREPLWMFVYEETGQRGIAPTERLEHAARVMVEAEKEARALALEDDGQWS